MEEFYKWIEVCWANTLPQDLLGKAFTYAQNQKKYLTAYLSDGRIEISNNRAERSIKPFVIGRKSWLFKFSYRMPSVLKNCFLGLKKFL